MRITKWENTLTFQDGNYRWVIIWTKKDRVYERVAYPKKHYYCIIKGEVIFNLNGSDDKKISTESGQISLIVPPKTSHVFHSVKDSIIIECEPRKFKPNKFNILDYVTKKACNELVEVELEMPKM